MNELYQALEGIASGTRDNTALIKQTNATILSMLKITDDLTQRAEALEKRMKLLERDGNGDRSGPKTC